MNFIHIYTYFQIDGISILSDTLTLFDNMFLVPEMAVTMEFSYIICYFCWMSSVLSLISFCSQQKGSYNSINLFF